MKNYKLVCVTFDEWDKDGRLYMSSLRYNLNKVYSSVNRAKQGIEPLIKELTSQDDYDEYSCYIFAVVEESNKDSLFTFFDSKFIFDYRLTSEKLFGFFELKKYGYFITKPF